MTTPLITRLEEAEKPKPGFDWSVPFLGVPEATIIAYRVTEGVKP